MSLCRRCLSGLLVLFLLLCGGCTWTPETSAPPVGETTEYPDPLAYEEAFAENWKYRYLDGDLQACYGCMYTALTDGFSRDETICVTGENISAQEHIGIRIPLARTLHSKEEAQRLYDAFFYDNPQFFYVSGIFTLEGFLANEEPYYTHLNLLYTMDSARRAQARQQLEMVVADWIAAAPTADAYETELYLHDRLAAACRYHAAAAKDGSERYPEAFTAYGALINGEAVCEGYSRAMQWLLKQAGIACTLVTGNSVYNGESHMWNMVMINGNRYHLDVTWDSSEQRLRHNYFNITTEQLLLSHTVNSEQLGIDVCTATADNYHVRGGTYLDTYRRQDIAEAIAAAVGRGCPSVELRFAPDKFDSALLFLKNESLTRQMVDAYLAGQGRAMGEYQLLGEPREYILLLYPQT